MKALFKTILLLCALLCFIFAISSCGEEPRSTHPERQNIDTLAYSMPQALRVVPGTSWARWNSGDSILLNGFALMSQDAGNSKERIVTDSAVLAWLVGVLPDSLALAGYADTLRLSNDTLYISGQNYVLLSDYMDNTDAQTLSFSNPNLSISGGNSVDLSALGGGGSINPDSVYYDPAIGGYRHISNNGYNQQILYQLDTNVTGDTLLFLTDGNTIFAIPWSTGGDLSDHSDVNGNFFQGAGAGGSGAADNIVIGRNTGDALTGTGNVLFGRDVSTDQTTGNYNVIQGYFAGSNLTSGSYNVASGWYALGIGVTTGSFNTAFGYQALYAITAGQRNFGVGVGAGKALTTGSYNIMLGDFAGTSAVTTNRQVYIGANAGQFMNGDDNIAIGNAPLVGTAGSSTGTGNVALGKQAGYKVTTGASNFFSGLTSGFNVTTGSYNLLYGQNAGYGITTGSDNIAFGRDVMMSSGTSAASNIVMGLESGYNVNGQKNIILGYQAGKSEEIQDNTLIIAHADGDDFIRGSMANDSLFLNSQVQIRDGIDIDGNVRITGTTSAFILPNLTTTERNALSAVNGMMIYNTTTNQIEAYENGSWIDL